MLSVDFCVVRASVQRPASKQEENIRYIYAARKGSAEAKRMRRRIGRSDRDRNASRRGGAGFHAAL